jgi:hypothetical protein
MKDYSAATAAAILVQTVVTANPNIATNVNTPEKAREFLASYYKVALELVTDEEHGRTAKA